jgi:hypothetical protein
MGMVVSPHRFAGGAAPIAPAFLCRFSANPPVDEATGATGTLNGNANVTGGTLNTDGSGDWCEWAGGTKFDMTSDWTLEAHIDHASLDGCIVGRATSGATRFWLYVTNTGTLQWIINATTILTGTVSVTSGGQHHVAVVHDSTAGRWSLYIDGVLDVSAVSSLLASTAATNVFMGASPGFTGTQCMNASIDRVKITKGCVYPYANGNFTPPAASAA